MGEGRWFEQNGGGELWVWRVDAQSLTQALEKSGLRLISRRAVELTELQWRVSAVLRRPLIWLNDRWQRAGGSPRGCATSLFVFEKTRPA